LGRGARGGAGRQSRVEIVTVAPKEPAQSGAPEKAEYLMSAEWNVDLDAEVDIWVVPPNKKPVFYGSRDVGCAQLDNDNRGFMVADLSITGARIFGKAPRSLGEALELELSDVRVAATIVRVEADAYAVAFARTFETRIAMIRLFYAGQHLRPLDHIRILRVGASVLRRVLD
jgi:PilZ domain